MHFLTAAEVALLRKRTGLSQAKFGQLLGVTGGSVAHWESGIRTPPPIYHACLIRLKDKLDTSPDHNEIANVLVGCIISGGMVAFLSWLFIDG